MSLNKLPFTTFKNQQIRDITKGYKLEDIVPRQYGLNNYVIEDGDRPDTVSFFAYDTPNLAWLVLLPNVKLDPYFEWPLSTREFEQHMIAKYGSIAASQSEILFYEHQTKDITISVDTYNHAGFYSEITAGDYTGVTAYSYFDRVNDNKRHIKLVPPAVVDRVLTQLDRLFDG